MTEGEDMSKLYLCPMHTDVRQAASRRTCQVTRTADSQSTCRLGNASNPTSTFPSHDPSLNARSLT